MDLNDYLETSNIQLALDSEHIRSCYKVMHQLRPHITSEDTFVQQVQRQMQQGYHLAYIRPLRKLCFY